MDRRAFLGTLAGGLLVAPLAVEAQRGKTPVVGVLGPRARPAGQREPIDRRFRELAWTPGSAIVIEQRGAGA